MNRRHFLFAGTSLTLLAACADENAAPQAGASAAPSAPVRHLLSLPRDSEPQRHDLAKFPTCTYCGRSREQAQDSRHVVQYADGSADPTCSLHCTAVSLAVNMERVAAAVYVADAGAPAETKPMVDAAAVTYLIGSSLPEAMSTRSKRAFTNLEEAMIVKSRAGGQLASFDGALAAAYADMVADNALFRRQRAAPAEAGDSGKK